MARIDLSWELSRLLVHVADVGTAIRMNSSYNEEHCHQNRQHVADDVMWLSDYLHCLDRLGLAIQSGNATRVMAACDSLQDYYRIFIDGTKGQGLKGDPKASTDRHQHLVRPKEAIAILAEIRTRVAATAARHVPTTNRQGAKS